MVVMVVVVGDLVVDIFVLGVIVVLGVVSCSCSCSCWVKATVSCPQTCLGTRSIGVSFVFWYFRRCDCIVLVLRVCVLV